MELGSLIDLIGEELAPKIKDNNEDVKEKLTIATLKYADLMSFRNTDYIFDPEKFASFDGKTGPYILYTVVRLKSLLKKSDIKNYELKEIPNSEVLDVLLKILELPTVLNRSYNDKSLNYITDFLFDLASLFNKFYNNYHILTEENENIKISYIAMTKLVYNVMHTLLNILAIDEVDMM